MRKIIHIYNIFMVIYINHINNNYLEILDKYNL